MTTGPRSSGLSEARWEGFFRMRVETKKDAYDVHLGLRGRHQAVNALVAIHLGEILGFDRSAIEYGLSASPWPGRLGACLPQIARTASHRWRAQCRWRARTCRVSAGVPHIEGDAGD